MKGKLKLTKYIPSMNCKIVIPLKLRKDGKPMVRQKEVVAGINGRNFVLPRGHYVMVPKVLLHVFDKGGIEYFTENKINTIFK